MAARHSFAHAFERFGPQSVDKPVAIISAFQGGRTLSGNRRANKDLRQELKRLNLGFYPVNGAGQEERRWLFGLSGYIVPSSEESFVFQPRDETLDAAFVTLVQHLLQKFGQFAALVKLPSAPQAFLLKTDGNREDKGSQAAPRIPQDVYYTQLKSGPRADASMLSSWEIHGEKNPIKRFINWLGGRSAMNRPADRNKIGRRFVIEPNQGV